MIDEDVIAAVGLRRAGRIYLSRSARQTLEAAALDRVEDFLTAVESGQSVTRTDEPRLVRRIERDVGGQPFVAYLKWYAPPPWVRGAFRWLRGRRTSGALTELQRIHRLRQADIDVPEPLAFGQDVALGRFRSFLLLGSMEHWATLEEIAHSQRFAEPLARVDVRRRLIDAVAGLVRRMHRSGIANPSLYSRHVVVESLETDPIRAGLIDLEDLELDVRVDDRRRAADLGALALTLQRECASLADRARFVRCYYHADRLDAVARGLIAGANRFYERNRYRRRFRHYAH